MYVPPSYLCIFPTSFLLQDERAYNEALRALDTNSSKIEKEKAKVEDHEASLAKEENVLEEIRDSLKGTKSSSLTQLCFTEPCL
jgi:ABC-type Fe3+-citrate transport system substrate-binding protein